MIQKKVKKDYYWILNVSMDDSETTIKKVYRKLAMQYHPDHNPNNPIAEEKFKEISEAAAVLTNSKKRVLYDNARVGAAIMNYGAQANHVRTSQPENKSGFSDLFKTVSKGFQDLREAWAKAGKECQAKQKKDSSVDGFTTGYNINQSNVYTSNGTFKATSGTHINDRV